MATNVKEGDLARIVNPPPGFEFLRGRIVRVGSKCPEFSLRDVLASFLDGKRPTVWWHCDPENGMHSLPDVNLRRIENPGDDEVSQETRKLPEEVPA